MVRFERTVRIKPGKMAEAFQWATEVAKFVNAKFPDGSDLYVFNQLFGDYGTIAWAIDRADLAEVEALTHKLVADPEYWEIVNQGASLVVEASTKDTLWQQVSP